MSKVSLNTSKKSRDLDYYINQDHFEEIGVPLDDFSELMEAFYRSTFKDTGSHWLHESLLEIEKKSKADKQVDQFDDKSLLEIFGSQDKIDSEEMELSSHSLYLIFSGYSYSQAA